MMAGAKAVVVNLPEPDKVKMSMDLVSKRAEVLNLFIKGLAEKYQVIGELEWCRSGGPSFRITKADAWSVYVLEPGGEELRLVTSVRLDWKLDFLVVAKQLVQNYVRKCRNLIERAETVLKDTSNPVKWAEEA